MGEGFALLSAFTVFWYNLSHTHTSSETITSNKNRKCTGMLTRWCNMYMCYNRRVTTGLFQCVNVFFFGNILCRVTGCGVMILTSSRCINEARSAASCLPMAVSTLHNSVLSCMVTVWLVNAALFRHSPSENTNIWHQTTIHALTLTFLY